MANKTIYVKDEALWEKAKQLGGEGGVSGFIAEALKEYIDRKDKEVNLRSGEMTPADLPVGGELHEEGSPHRIAFNGRLLYDTDVEADPRCMVFETQSKRILLYKVGRDRGATYQLFSTLEDLARSTDARNNFWLHDGLGHGPQEGIREIAAKLGREPVVWID